MLVQLLQPPAEIPSQWRSAVCWQAADSLIDIEQYHQLVTETLLEVIQTAYCDYPPLPVIRSLNKIDPTHQLAISALIQLLQTPQISECLRQRADLWQVAEELGCLGVGNPVVIDALTQFIATAEDESGLRYAAASLGNIDPGNATAIHTLIKLVQTAEDSYARLQALYSLGQIGIGNQAAIETLVEFLQTFEDDGDNYEYVLRLATGWEKALQKTNLSQLVMALSKCMTEQVYQHHAYRYDACYHLLWKAAQHMTYPDFYQAYVQLGEQAATGTLNLFGNAPRLTLL